MCTVGEIEDIHFLRCVGGILATNPSLIGTTWIESIAGRLQVLLELSSHPTIFVGRVRDVVVCVTQGRVVIDQARVSNASDRRCRRSSPQLSTLSSGAICLSCNDDPGMGSSLVNDAGRAIQMTMPIDPVSESTVWVPSARSRWEPTVSDEGARRFKSRSNDD
ncbi:hypothetical protein KIN20_015003 [Parelaphostrongylus tenuis]|uniref:Uncharacterized protein n=1 Tax=Parelaphostrongylus tenuis TaxID=148309 RepID=A0AAD5MXX7_PARTN|nr:hypothetical protein KIN20_015003 [Parelaphostrongylus tenuis]